jgi:glycosyltransferase involved in cell wall biosynthesis
VKALCYGDFAEAPYLKKVSPERKGWTHTLWHLYWALSPRSIVHDHSRLLAYPDDRLIRTFHRVIRHKKARWIVTLHDESLPERLPTWPEAIRALYPGFLHWPDHIICVGEGIYAYLLRLGLPRGKLSNISPLLPLRPTADLPLPGGVHDFIASHSPIITAIGAFHSNYDLLTLANAFGRILSAYPGAGLVLLDAGFSRDMPYKEELLQVLAHQLDRSHIVLSKVPHALVLRILRESALLVRGVRSESFGLSRAEAILMGTPVVATRTGETRHMTLYEYGNLEDLAQKVLGILERKPDLSEAQDFFRQMGNDTLTRILDVYATAHD